MGYGSQTYQVYFELPQIGAPGIRRFMENKKRQRHASFKEALAFSLTIFWPIMALLILPFLWLGASSILCLLIAFTSSLPRHETSQAIMYSIWAFSPLGAVAIILISGASLYLYIYRKPGLPIRFLVWIVFSAGFFFGAIYFSAFIYGNAGAVDCTTRYLLMLIGGTAVGLTLIAQVVIVPWVLYSVKSYTVEPHRTPD